MRKEIAVLEEDRARCFRNLVGIFAYLPVARRVPLSRRALSREIRGIVERHPELLPGLHFSQDGCSGVLEDFLFCARVWRQLNFPSDERSLDIALGVEETFQGWIKTNAYSPEELAIIAKEGQALSERISRGLTDKKLRPHWLIFGLLAQFPVGYTPPVAKGRLHKAIKEIRDRHLDLFRGLAFSTDPAPWSRTLERALFMLGHSGVVPQSMKGELKIRRELAEEFQQHHADRFTPEELAIIREEGAALGRKVIEGELSPQWARK